MREITCDELRNSIAITMASQSSMRTKSGPSATMIADHLIQFLFGGLVVFKPDTVGLGLTLRPGKFGEDEPHPLELISALAEGKEATDALKAEFPRPRSVTPI